MRWAAAACAAALLAGCGGDPGDERLVVSAAASLTEALGRCARSFDGPAVRTSFAGSDELAAQIRQGVRPDVFAAADERLPAELAREGRVARPVAFATNRLVVAVPADSRVRRIEDLARAGTTIAAGAPGVPAGAAARRVLGALGGTGRRVLANVRTEEPDVKGVLGKVTRGGADAGFVYATDVAAAGDRVRAVRLSDRLDPQVTYAAAVVRGAPNPGDARRFVDGLVRGGCADALRDAGFGPPPGR
jgi:molybdate transport system substrate-binding protein